VKNTDSSKNAVFHLQNQSIKPSHHRNHQKTFKKPHPEFKIFKDSSTISQQSQSKAGNPLFLWIRLSYYDE